MQHPKNTALIRETLLKEMGISRCDNEDEVIIVEEQLDKFCISKTKTGRRCNGTKCNKFNLCYWHLDNNQKKIVAGETEKKNLEELYLRTYRCKGKTCIGKRCKKFVVEKPEGPHLCNSHTKELK